MKKLLAIGIFISLLVACKKEKEPKSKVSYNKKEKANIQPDTTKIIVTENPIHFENLSVLIYPIGDTRSQNNKKGEYLSSDYYENTTGFNISNTIEDEISGYLSNIKFQKIGQDSLVKLTEKQVLIERMTLLKSNRNFVYVLADEDTNQDEKIDSDDIKSLYISDTDGTEFTKISTDLHEIIDWKYLEVNNRIYFRTIDDRNKNGKFDPKDSIHYFYYSFREKKSVEYNPI